MNILPLAVALFAAATFLPASVHAQRVETGFLNRTVGAGDGARRYQVYVPLDYSANQRWPVILFLHGSGEAGDDGLLQTEIGLGGAVRRYSDRWPAIIVFPQARGGEHWTKENAASAMKALEQTEREFVTDPDRVYLTGLSRGGAGSYFLAYRNPGRFAAMLVACGFVQPLPTSSGLPAPDWESAVSASEGDPFDAIAAKLAGTPIWLFHGDADTVVPVDEARRVVAAFKKINVPIRYTELPGVGHNAWDAAFGTAEVSPWLFAQRRKR